MRHAVLGAFVGDAASLGTHWIYDPKAMAGTVTSVEAPEFRTPPAMKFYSPADYPGHYASGMLSPYGEQLLFVAEHLAEKGRVDGAAMVAATRAWARDVWTGRKDSATKQFLAKDPPSKADDWRAAGVADHEAHCFMKVVPATVLYAGCAERRSKVEDAIRTLQDDDLAAQFGLVASDILEHAIVTPGATPAEALAAVEHKYEYPAVVQTALNEARAELPLEELLLKLSREMTTPDSPFRDLAARSCALPGAFIAVAYHFAHPATSASYVPALRANILAAGDTCSRAVMLGAVFGAAAGADDEVPWLDKLGTTKHPRTGETLDLANLVESIATALVDANAQLRLAEKSVA